LLDIVRPIHRPPSRLVEIFESALIEHAKLIKKQIASLVSL
jgi:predicted protein tyrosine phosphatase